MITYTQSKRLCDIVQAYSLLENLSDHYPDFKHWFFNKAVPGIMLNKDIMVLALHDNQVIGVALAKSTRSESKLRCVRIHPSYQNKGVGIRLIENTLRLMNTDQPSCTVTESMMGLMSRVLVNYFDFKLTHVYKGLYIPNVLEYAFNEPKIK